MKFFKSSKKFELLPVGVTKKAKLDAKVSSFICFRANRIYTSEEWSIGLNQPNELQVVNPYPGFCYFTGTHS